MSSCFTGPIPTELGQLIALTQLDLSDNELTGECDYLIAIGKRVYHSLNLTHCSVCFTGPIPTELGQLTALTHLCLNNNQLTGACD